jgi:hypothetical protein
MKLVFLFLGFILGVISLEPTTGDEPSNIHVPVTHIVPTDGVPIVAANRIPGENHNPSHKHLDESLETGPALNVDHLNYPLNGKGSTDSSSVLTVQSDHYMPNENSQIGDTSHLSKSNGIISEIGTDNSQFHQANQEKSHGHGTIENHKHLSDHPVNSHGDKGDDKLRQHSIGDISGYGPTTENKENHHTQTGRNGINTDVHVIATNSDISGENGMSNSKGESLDQSGNSVHPSLGGSHVPYTHVGAETMDQDNHHNLKSMDDFSGTNDNGFSSGSINVDGPDGMNGPNMSSRRSISDDSTASQPNHHLRGTTSGSDVDNHKTLIRSLPGNEQGSESNDNHSTMSGMIKNMAHAAVSGAIQLDTNAAAD